MFCEHSSIMDGVEMESNFNPLLGEPKRRLPFKQKIKQVKTTQYINVDICTLRVLNLVIQRDDGPHCFHIVDHRLLVHVPRLVFFVSRKYRLLPDFCFLVYVRFRSWRYCRFVGSSHVHNICPAFTEIPPPRDPPRIRCRARPPAAETLAAISYSKNSDHMGHIKTGTTREARCKALVWRCRAVEQV